MSFLVTIGTTLKEMAGLIFPVFAASGGGGGFSQRIRWAIHFTLIGLILVGLTFINNLLSLPKLLETPLPMLRVVWLPLLFLLVYLLSWVAWWLWILLGAEEESSHHPDLDTAWQEAVAALRQANIDPAAVPLFLVLGRPAGTEKALFTGAQLELTIENEPRRPDAPIHVYASKEAIFVTCAETSLLGEMTSLMLSDEAGAAASVNESSDMFAQGKSGSGSSEVSSPRRSAAKAGQPRIGEPAAKVSSGPAPMSLTMSHVNVEEPAGTTVLTPPEKAPAPVRKTPARQPFLKNAAEIRRITVRFRHFCWLIQRQRRPYCPINGILLVLPYAATASDAAANQTGQVCQRDLESISGVLQIRCPIFALVADMEMEAGFEEFIDRFPRGHRQRRLGQQFPYVPEIAAQEATDLVDGGVRWICLDLFPPLVYRLMRLDKPGPDRMSTILQGNIRLYQLMVDMRQRWKRLSRILALALVPPERGPVYFGGCYLAGTGLDASREQAFIAAVFHRLLESQNYVSWTEAGEAEEMDYRRWARFGYVALAVFALFVLVLGYGVIFHS